MVFLVLVPYLEVFKSRFQGFLKCGESSFYLFKDFKRVHQTLQCQAKLLKPKCEQEKYLIKLRITTSNIVTCN